MNTTMKTTFIGLGFLFFSACSGNKQEKSDRQLISKIDNNLKNKELKNIKNQTVINRFKGCKAHN